MKPYLKFGLLVGLISLLFVIPVAALMGICAPFITMITAAIAGFLTAYFGKAVTRRDGAQSGAIAGAICGGITLIGQLIGGILVLIYIQMSETPMIFGNAPSLSAPLLEIVVYYASGLGTGLCFGLVGIILGAIAGGATGALGTRELPPEIIAPDASVEEPPNPPILD